VVGGLSGKFIFWFFLSVGFALFCVAFFFSTEELPIFLTPSSSPPCGGDPLLIFFGVNSDFIFVRLFFFVFFFFFFGLRAGFCTLWGVGSFCFRFFFPLVLDYVLCSFFPLFFGLPLVFLLVFPSLGLALSLCGTSFWSLIFFFFLLGVVVGRFCEIL